MQRLMGWEGAHMHQFARGKNPYRAKTVYVDPMAAQFDLGMGTFSTTREIPGDQVPVTELLPSATASKAAGWSPRDASYLYDFGDDWLHRLRRIPVPDDVPILEAHQVALLTSSGGTAIEDCGGVPGRFQLLDEFRARERGETSQDRWARELFDDWFEGVSLEEVREVLVDVPFAKVARALTGLSVGGVEGGAASAAGGQVRPELAEVLRATDATGQGVLAQAVRALDLDSVPAPDHDDALALTADIRIFMEAVGDGLELTKTGYLKPKDAEPLAERLRLGEEWVGSLKRESDVHPLWEFRQALRQLRLVRVQKEMLLPVKSQAKTVTDPEKLVVFLVEHLLRLGDEDLSLQTVLWTVDRLLAPQQESLGWDFNAVVGSLLVDVLGESATAKAVVSDLAPLIWFLERMGVFEESRGQPHSGRELTTPGRRFLAAMLRG
nr:hypothetical protein [Nesterenkonia muleiensis]